MHERNFDEVMDDMLDEIRALNALTAEKLRARRIDRGEDPDPPVRSVAEIRAETVALRRENDERLKRLRATRPRRTHLRRVQ